MRRAQVCLFSAALAASVIGFAPAATAAGGYFVPSGESSKVTRHRTLIAYAGQNITIVDQIEFAPAPDSFAWVFPVKGPATIEPSSDALFNNLDAVTRTAVEPPPLDCPPTNCGTGGMGGAGGGLPTEVVPSRPVVDPYESISTAPGAGSQSIREWLGASGYVIDAATSAVFDALDAEVHGYIGVRFAPNAADVAARPIRVTQFFSSVPVLPLRIARTGAPASLPTRLYVVASSRAETQNMPAVTVSLDNLVWNWDTETSNYDALRQDAFNVVGGQGWVVEHAAPFPVTAFRSAMVAFATAEPAASGWGDAAEAPNNCTSDMDAIFAGLDPTATWVTRLEANLGPAGFMQDLALGTSMNQDAVPSTIVVKEGATQGTPPACPDPCGSGGMGGMGGNGGMGGMPSGSGGMGGMGGGGGAGIPDVCIPGEQVECACPGGSVGAQACDENGAGFETCQCLAPEENSGCGCKAAGAGAGSAGVALGFVALVGGLVRRRRRAGRS